MSFKKNYILFIGELPKINNTGGSNSLNISILKILSKEKNLLFTVITPIFDKEKIVIDKNLLENIKIIEIKTRYLKYKSLSDILSRIDFTKKLNKIIKNLKLYPDLIHIDNYSYIANNHFFLKKPKIIFLHGSAYYSIKSKFDIFIHPYGNLVSYLNYIDEKQALYNPSVKKILINSKYSYNRIINDYNLKEDKIINKIIPIKLACNIDRFKIGISKEGCIEELSAKFKINLRNKYPILLSIGGISKHRNQRDLIENINFLKKYYPEILLILTGKDSGDLRYCIKLAKKYNILNRNVLFTGNLDGENLGKIFKISDIYINKCSESFGIALLEALSMGLPAVVYNLGAVSEILKNNEYGFLVESDEEFIEKILYLANNKELIKEMGNNARTYTLNNYSLEKTCSIIKNIYLEVINESNLINKHILDKNI